MPKTVKSDVNNIQCKTFYVCGQVTVIGYTASNPEETVWSSCQSAKCQDLTN